MRAYRKIGWKKMLAAAGIFVILAALLVGTAYAAGRKFARVEVKKTYYFLVRGCEESTAAAVAGQVYVAGGAGYLWGDCVILSCYFLQSDAERVRSVMRQQGIEAEIRAEKIDSVILNGGKAEQAVRVGSNLEVADTCAHILYDCANGLERGSLSQTEAREGLRGVQKSLEGLRKGNGTLSDAWDRELYRAERRAAELSEGILFSKDLRYLQISLILAVLSAGEYFA